MFDAFLRQGAASTGEPFRPFEINDYQLYVDGRPRYDGVHDFLGSRGIELTEGSMEDPTRPRDFGGLGNRKDDMVTEVTSPLESTPIGGPLHWCDTSANTDCALPWSTASANCAAVLEEARIADLFDASPHYS